MRSRRERPPAPLIIALAISAAAAFFGGGASTRTLPWVGGAAVVAVAALVVVRGLPRGWPALVPLVALALWCALSIGWSDLGDRSWDYANRTLVYAAFAALGLFLADRTRELAAGLAAVLGAVVVWSLAGKALPWLYDDYGRIARLRAPVGIWNQLALLGDYALPLALWLAWRRRVLGALLAYGWLIAIVLTYSRGGVLVAVAVVAAWFVLSRRWVEAGATLLAAGVPATAVVGVALLLPGVTDDGRPRRRGLRARPARRRRGCRRGRACAAPGTDAGAAPGGARRGSGRRRGCGLRRRGSRSLALARLHERDRDAASELVRALRRRRVEPSLGVVEAGVERLGGAAGRRHGGGLVRAHEPPLPNDLPRPGDGAAQRAAAVPVGDGPRRARAAPRRSGVADRGGGAAARPRARALAAPAGVRAARVARHRLGLPGRRGARVPGRRRARGAAGP